MLIREVPWERIESTRRELQAEIASSDIHPDEWDTDRRDSAKRKLLRGLQVSDDPAWIEVLGRSEFRTTDRVRADDGPLADFAAKVGASRVVFASTLLGKADRIVYEPVTTWTWGGDWYRRGAHGGDRYNDGYHEHATSWVPVRVQADETAWVAYFLCETPPAGSQIK